MWPKKLARFRLQKKTVGVVVVVGFSLVCFRFCFRNDCGHSHEFAMTSSDDLQENREEFFYKSPTITHNIVRICSKPENSSHSQEYLKHISCIFQNVPRSSNGDFVPYRTGSIPEWHFLQIVQALRTKHTSLLPFLHSSHLP